MRKNIVLCGVGGQGTVLASRLISAAAMAKGIPVMSAETIGMAQRGGSVFSHLRLGEDVYSPMIARGEADLILAFEPGEAVRMLPYLREGGQVVVSSRPVMPVTATLSGASYSAEEMIHFLQAHVKNLMVVDAEKALQDVSSSKVLNLILLGAALQSEALGLTEDEIKAAIVQKIPEKFHELNFRALAWAGQNM
ncbi:MAG: indolepyruvate oxidoreductase subunit beta [Clostridia bacterium]|nr:indolepyruvate oxidoreductase subunit beta [Clostridia bacterium]